MMVEGGFEIRPATMADADALREILNRIIAIGGTTAHEVPMALGEFQDLYVGGPECLSCLIAETAADEALGFQALTRNPDLPRGWGDIATFTRREPRRPGVGAALFKATERLARDLGLVAINATIRADNYAGIPYYEKIGFQTYKVAPAVPLLDGTTVDRVSKVFRLD